MMMGLFRARIQLLPTYVLRNIFLKGGAVEQLFLQLTAPFKKLANLNYEMYVYVYTHFFFQISYFQIMNRLLKLQESICYF